MRATGDPAVLVHPPYQPFERRGPPLLQPLLLPAQPARLSALLAARKSRRIVPQSPPSTTGSHVLDRTATLAG
jgi:hypothetical protein